MSTTAYRSVPQRRTPISSGANGVLVRPVAANRRLHQNAGIEIVDASVDTQFEEQADAAAWLVKRISAALEQFEEAARGNSADLRSSLSFGPPARPVAHQEPHRAGGGLLSKP
jgi:hypothetical protein